MAETLNVPQQTLSRWIEDFTHFGQLSDLGKIAAEFSDFQAPLYNVWKRQVKTNEVSHPGNSEQTIVENLLHAYTNPFDVVVDPFAGGGSTIDVCRARETGRAV